jgi:hypothetical protein
MNRISGKETGLVENNRISSKETGLVENKQNQRQGNRISRK